MDRIFEQNLLYDFYGELLTEHQQRIYEDAVYNDMSLSEIAQEQGISRQGVHDLIKRCDKLLQGYEDKLHLVERFMGAKEKIQEIEKLTLLDVQAEAFETELRLEEKALAKANDKAIFEDVTEEVVVENIDITYRMQRIRELSKELMKEW